jgi:hypothetical protein
LNEIFCGDARWDWGFVRRIRTKGGRRRRALGDRWERKARDSRDAAAFSEGMVRSILG